MSPVSSHPSRRLFGFDRLIPIPQHDVSAPNAELSHLARWQDLAVFALNRDFDTRYRNPDRSRFALAVNGIEGNHRAGFAQTVAFDQGKGKLAGELFEGFDRQRCGAADAQSQRQIRRHRRMARARKTAGCGQNRRPTGHDLLQQVLERVQRLRDHHPNNRSGAAARCPRTA